MIGRLVFLILAGSVSLNGCKRSHQDSSAAPADAVSAIKIVSVPEVERLVTEKSAVILDANGPDTRKEYGVVPGAVLLSAGKSYALTELPEEKATKLVFYCGGTMCRASDGAAARAAAAGYKDIGVMREGIKGWRSAGKQTVMPQS